MATSARARAGVVLLATIVGVGVAMRLGLWQLDRAAQKLALQKQIETRRSLPPLPSTELALDAAAAPAQHYRRVALRGTWIAGHTVYLENRQMNGRPGFYVVTPLQLEGRAEAVAVQRGWAPRDFRDRAALPVLRTSAGITVVEGLIAPPPSRLYEFSALASGPIRQNLDLDAYAREARLTLLPLTVRQGDSVSTAADGLLREWPAPALNLQTNYGYAFQWFALGALMAGLYVWFQLVRPRFRKH